LEFGENLQSISQKCEKIWFLRQDPEWSDLIFARDQIYPGKGQKRAKGPNQNIGASKCYLGPNFWNLAAKGSTRQPWLRLYSTV